MLRPQRLGTTGVILSTYTPTPDWQTGKCAAEMVVFLRERTQGADQGEQMLPEDRHPRIIQDMAGGVANGGQGWLV